MSGIFISSYSPFRRIKIVKQVVEPNATKAVIDVVPSASIPCAMCADKRPPTFTVGSALGTGPQPGRHTVYRLWKSVNYE
jgi:hypothetical protein